jgi:hypothetical protein
MKTFKEYNQLDEGILDTVKNVVKSIGRGIGKGVVGVAKYGAQTLGAIPGGLIGGFKSGMGGGSGGYSMARRGGGSSRKIEQLKAELEKARAGNKPSRKPKAPKPPSGLGPKPTTPPTGAPTKVPSPTGSAPVPPATPTPAVPAPAAPVPAPVKTLTKAEKKDRRDAARTVGGVTSRLDKKELYTDAAGVQSLRGARTDPAKERLAAKGIELETKRAALQTKTGKLRKGVDKKDIKSFNIDQEMTKGNIIKSGSIASNPELANKLAAARARIARTKAKSGQVMGAYESTDLLNSVMKFLDK